jgi:chemosensory pili system protein ChpC
MVPLTGGRMLVPNTTMAEVITFAPPKPVAGAPAWLLGRLAWRGWGLPVLAFSVLAGVATSEVTQKARVAVLKALNGNPRVSYFGVLSQGFPRLTLVAADTLLRDAEDATLPVGVSQRVRMHDEVTWIPDLATIEAMIADALAVAD